MDSANSQRSSEPATAGAALLICAILAMGVLITVAALVIVALL